MLFAELKDKLKEGVRGFLVNSDLAG